jgi:hypothetical protein
MREDFHVHQMKSNTALASFLVVVAVFFQVGCENSDEKAIANAQSCLDQARTSDDANRCFALVQDMDSASANLIKCSARYIQQGFTGARFASAFEQLKDNPSGGSSDAMTSTLSFLSFSSPAAATETYGFCEKSGLKSLIRLSVMSRMATTIISAAQQISAPGCPALGQVPDGSTNMATCLSNLASNGTPAILDDKEQLGQIAVIAKDAYCGEGSSFNNTDICNNLNQAIQAGGGDPTAIANQLLNLLQ